MQHGVRLVWGYGCPQTPMTRHIIEIDDNTGDGWCCQCAETFSHLEIYNERLREALTWAVGFIACNSTDRSYQEYPDYQNAEALVSGGIGLMSGPFQLALSQIEVLQQENERLLRWRRLLIETPKGESRQTGLERFAQVEALQPMIEPWREKVAEYKAEILLYRSKLDTINATHLDYVDKENARQKN